MSSRILGLVYINEHQALYGAATMYADVFRIKGRTVDILNLAQPDALAKLSELLQPDQIDFCFAPQGVGSRLGSGDVTIWEKRRIPFIGIHGDNPCYNIFNHFNNTSFVANLYLYESFADLHRRYIGGDQVTGSMPFRTGDILLARPPYRERPIRLLYLKKGESVAECEAKLNSLPPRLRDSIWQQMERVKASPNLLICDLVQEIFDALNENRAQHFDLFWGCVHWMDMYIRRKRAADFVNWMKMQHGAVIVGDGWDFIDKTNAKAEFRPSVDISVAGNLYQQAQIICNTTPYGRDVLHERTVFGMMNESLTISDTNAWWDQHFGDVPGLKLYSWNEPLDDQLRPMLSMPVDEAEAKAAAARPVALQHFYYGDMADNILAFANTVRQRNGLPPVAM